MKIYENVYLVGSGQIGISNRMDSHIYLIRGEDKTVLIDSGVGIDSNSILKNIQKEGLDPNNIDILLLTHSHSDHAGGAAWIKLKTACKVMASEKEAQIIQEGSDLELGLDRAKKSEIYPQEYKFNHCKVDNILKDEEVLDLGGYKIKIILVGGHSPLSACFLLEGEKMKTLFSGDVVFFGGTIGLGNWPGSSLEAYRRDISKLQGLDVNALLPGHFLWTLRDGQEFLDKAVENLQQAWVPPMWQTMHHIV